MPSGRVNYAFLPSRNGLCSIRELEKTIEALENKREQVSEKIRKSKEEPDLQLKIQTFQRQLTDFVHLKQIEKDIFKQETKIFQLAQEKESILQRINQSTKIEHQYRSAISSHLKKPLDSLNEDQLVKMEEQVWKECKRKVAELKDVFNLELPPEHVNAAIGHLSHLTITISHILSIKLPLCLIPHRPFTHFRLPRSSGKIDILPIRLDEGEGRKGVGKFLVALSLLNFCIVHLGMRVGMEITREKFPAALETLTALVDSAELMVMNSKSNVRLEDVIETTFALWNHQTNDSLRPPDISLLSEWNLL